MRAEPGQAERQREAGYGGVAEQLRSAGKKRDQSQHASSRRR